MMFFVFAEKAEFPDFGFPVTAATVAIHRVIALAFGQKLQKLKEQKAEEILDFLLEFASLTIYFPLYKYFIAVDL